VFIVGATGVLGRAVVPRLLARGDTVVALVRSLERAEAIRGDGVDLFEGDLLRESPERLAAMLAGCDAAAHLATALAPGSTGPDGTNTNAALRIDGTRRLLDAVLAAGVRRYVQQSITMAYRDGGDTWLDESTPFDGSAARSTTARPVVEMEAMVRALDAAAVEWSILRGALFVGPDTRQDAAIAGLRDGTLTVPGDGCNWASFVHVGDYADAVVAALHSAPARSVYNVADEPVRNGEYLDRLAATLGVAAPRRDPAAPLPASHRCSSTAIREALGWRPEAGIWPPGHAKQHV
jgi:nucleoside-diphosphate-sugar epimerase